MTQPALTDRAALAAHRHRAARHPDGMARFLHDSAADELEERLAEVNKRLPDVAVVSGFPSLWREYWPQARHIADADILDLAPASADLVIHALALHWADDPVGQLVQARRALRPDGLFLGVMLGGETLSELRSALAEAEIARTGGLSPRVAPMGEIRDLGGLLQRAGFALPVADSVPLTASYRDALHLMHDLRAMGETNALAQRHKSTPSRTLFAHAAATYSTRFALPDGRVRATFELVFLTGWAPSDTQQKPLRPGTAKTRLADALRVPEQPLPGPKD